MLTNIVIVSNDIFFINGMKNILKNISITVNRRCVFIDASLYGYMPYLSLSDSDAVFYITPYAYSSALKSLFIECISNGEFIEAHTDAQRFKIIMINFLTGKTKRFCRAKLTIKETLVLRALIKKGTYARCATSLNISRKTVSLHKLKAMEKLGIDNLSDLVILFNKLILQSSRFIYR